MTTNDQGGRAMASFTIEDAFTAKQLIAWAEEQKKWSNSVWTKDLNGPEAYEQALNHLIHYVKNPIKEII